MLFTGLDRAAKSAGLDVVVNWIGSMGTLFFAKEAVKDFDSAKKSDLQMFRNFYAGMLEQGIYLALLPLRPGSFQPLTRTAPYRRRSSLRRELLGL